MAARATLSHDDYTVGWICALPLEMAAAKLMLDAIHPSLPSPPTDQNTYILGNIGDHNIVIACLPSGAYGNVSAATVAMQLLSSFRSIRFGLMVGIGGGVPNGNADIRLGDIVVSQPTDTSGGVIQYDLGKASSGGQFQRTGMLNRPPKVLLTALATLQAHHFTEDSRVLEFISDVQAKTTPRRAANFTRPTQEDCLYQSEYNHGGSDTCIHCDRFKLAPRLSRDYEEPVIHYGLIASANQVVKDGRRRDQLAQDLGVYCVEMEAAGLMNDFPCLVIRGICDYADSHKNKKWQGYAAAVAAAYGKELLLVVPIDQIDNTLTARGTLVGSAHRFDIPLDLSALPVIPNPLGRQWKQALGSNHENTLNSLNWLGSTSMLKKKKPNSVADAVNDDNSVIKLSKNTMESLHLRVGDVVLVKGKKGKDTVLVVLSEHELEDGYACINLVIRDNLRVKYSDLITIYPCPNIKFVNRIAVLPIADTIEGFTGSLFDLYLAPYFCEAYRPVRQGDLFTVRGGKRQVEFKVVEVDPPEYGIVAQDTTIYCDGEPIQRD